MEKIDNALAQSVHTPGKPGMNGWNKIKADGEHCQYSQAKQNLENSGYSFQHGQDYTAIREKADSHQSYMILVFQTINRYHPVNWLQKKANPCHFWVERGMIPPNGQHGKFHHNRQYLKGSLLAVNQKPTDLPAGAYRGGRIPVPTACFHGLATLCRLGR